MPKPPKPKKPKDPARPTRSKAAAEHMKPLAPALEQLLNPGIAKGTAGVGSQTGFSHRAQESDASSPPPLRGRSTREARREGGEQQNAAQVSTPLPNPPPTQVGPA